MNVRLSETIVVLTACFPQDRIAFLAFLALCCGFCAFAATLLRNFASYSAAPAGYTAGIVADDNLGTTGGAGPDVFMLAVFRASEIVLLLRLPQTDTKVSTTPWDNRFLFRLLTCLLRLID